MMLSTLFRRLLVAPFGLFVLAAMPAQAQPRFPVEIFEYLDNVRLVAFVDQADIDSSRQWTPDAGAPPLDIAALMRLIKSRAGAAGKPGIERIELRPLPGHATHWHYIVQLSQPEASGARRKKYLVVLMNGKVIPAIQEPESFK